MLAFSSVSLLAGMSAFLLPETVGKELPVTVAEAEATDNSPGVVDCVTCGINRRLQRDGGKAKGEGTVTA